MILVCQMQVWIESEKQIENCQICGWESSSSLWLCILKDPHAIEATGRLTDRGLLHSPSSSPHILSPSLLLRKASQSKSLLVIHLHINLIIHHWASTRCQVLSWAMRKETNIFKSLHLHSTRAKITAVLLTVLHLLPGPVPGSWEAFISIYGINEPTH